MVLDGTGSCDEAAFNVTSSDQNSLVASPEGREGEIELRFEGTGETLTVTFVRSTNDDGLAGTQATLQAVQGDLKALAGCPELQ